MNVFRGCLFALLFMTLAACIIGAGLCFWIASLQP